MQERRKYPRVTVDVPATIMAVDIPATIRFPQHPGLPVRLIELSEGGARFLCALAPEINSVLELRFSLLSHRIGHEFRLAVNVRHLYDVVAMTGKEHDYRHVVGGAFQDLQPQDRAILKEYCAAGRTQ